MHRHPTLAGISILAVALAGAAFAQSPPPRPKPPRVVSAAVHGEPLAPAKPCKPGFVWREAGPPDHVCVEPWARDRVRQENIDQYRHARRVGLGRPEECLAGYVYRQAFFRDFVCVTPTAHAQAQDENAAGPSRQAG